MNKKEDLTLRVRALNELVKSFRFQEALNEFYDNEIINVENESPPITGLTAYRQAAARYLANISNESATLLNVIVSDDMSVCEWHYKFNHKEWGPWDAVQLSVQRWKNGKIIHERHHYKT